jgi:hypothetical protein
MIDTLVKIVEKLTQLIKYRKELREKQFEKLITPLYEDLQIVHSDYLKLLTEVLVAIQNDSKIEEIAKLLMTKRIEKESLRKNIIDFSDIFLKEKSLERFHPLLTAIKFYFYKRDIEYYENDSWTQVLFWYLESMADNQPLDSRQRLQLEEEQPLKTLHYLVNEMLEEIRERWSNISRQYASLLAGNST